jgi:hypothetical protein
VLGDEESPPFVHTIGLPGFGHPELRSGAVHLLGFPESEHRLFAADDLYRVPVAPQIPALPVVPAEGLTPTPGDDLPCTLYP